MRSNTLDAQQAAQRADLRELCPRRLRHPRFALRTRPVAATVKRRSAGTASFAGWRQ
jgi:hypothetical protein